MPREGSSDGGLCGIRFVRGLAGNLAGVLAGLRGDVLRHDLRVALLQRTLHDRLDDGRGRAVADDPYQRVDRVGVDRDLATRDKGRRGDG